jgi:hypothetical protein
MNQIKGELESKFQENQQLKNTIDKNSQENQQLKHTIDKNSQENQQLKHTIDKNFQENQRLKAELTKVSVEKQKSLADITGENQKLKAKLDTLSKEKAKSDELDTSSKNKLDLIIQEKTDLKTQMENLSKTKEELKSQIENLLKSNSDLQLQLLQPRQSSQSQESQKFQQVQSKMKDLQIKLENLQTAKAKVELDFKALSAEKQIISENNTKILSDNQNLNREKDLALRELLEQEKMATSKYHAQDLLIKSLREQLVLAPRYKPGTYIPLDSNTFDVLLKNEEHCRQISGYYVKVGSTFTINFTLLIVTDQKSSKISIELPVKPRREVDRPTILGPITGQIMGVTPKESDKVQGYVFMDDNNEIILSAQHGWVNSTSEHIKRSYLISSFFVYMI